MVKNVFKKIYRTIFLLIGITFVSFLLTFYSPGDPATMMLKKSGMLVSEETIEIKREELGLNDSFIEQYFRWMFNMVHGDMGVSYKTNKPVIYELKKTIPPTMILTVAAMFLTALISIPIGILCARYKDGVFDNIIRFITYLFASLPSFFLSLIIMYVLSVKLKLFPIIASANLKGIVMPVLVLSLTLSSWYIRQIRGMVLSELNQEYVEGLRSRGISNKRILFFHVLKNCLFPILTLMGMSFGILLGGSSIVENIFSWPGIGKLAISSISARDYPVIQSYVVWMAIAYLIINLFVEITCQLLDPRLRKGKSN